MTTNAHFTMFTKKGVRISINVDKEEGSTLFESFAATVEDLTKKGWGFNEPGLKIGQKSVRICGWTYTQRKDGKPVVDLYYAGKAKHPLHIWEEQIPELQFDPVALKAKQVPKGMSSEKEFLIDTEYWHACDFEVVMENPNENGYCQDFVSVKGYSPKLAEEAREATKELFTDEKPEAAEDDVPDF